MPDVLPFGIAIGGAGQNEIRQFPGTTRNLCVMDRRESADAKTVCESQLAGGINQRHCRAFKWKRFAHAAIRGEIDVLVQYGLKFIPC